MVKGSMIIKIFLIITVIISFGMIHSSCDKSTDSSEDENNNLTLEKCFQDSSLAEFETYLNTWHVNINPVSPNEFLSLSDTLRSIYQIYSSFYDPFHLEKYCTTGRCSEFGNNFYEGLEYVIVQNKIRYTFGSDNSTLIKNFCPPVKFDAITLYLTDTYLAELDSFLSVEQHPNEILNRLNFLNQKLKIIHGHWFGWHFTTHPEVESISFTSNLDSATVYFRIIFEGGQAKFKHDVSGWQFIESYLTWIE